MVSVVSQGGGGGCMRKAQVTVFIIMGVLALLFVGVLLYVVSQSFVLPVVEGGPAGLVAYVEDCLLVAGKEAVRNVGLQGGLADPVGFGLQSSNKPAEGDVLVFGDRVVPYWWYMESENTCKHCVLRSVVPSDEVVAGQISGLVEAGVVSCVNGFVPFVEQGYHISAGEVVADVVFSEEDVGVDLRWSLVVTRGSVEFFVSSFSARLDVPLKRLLGVARGVVEREREDAWLEQVILHGLGVFSGVSSLSLPPVSSLSHGSVVLVWVKGVVEGMVSAAVQAVMPLVSYGKEGVLLVGEPVSFDVSVHFFGWPLFVDVSPRSGGLLSPDVVRTRFPISVVPSFQTNSYEFFYDVSVPVLVEVRDVSAFHGEGFSFFFAMEGNVRDNLALQDFFVGKGTVSLKESVDVVVSEMVVVNVSVEECVESGAGFSCPLDNKVFDGLVDCQLSCKEVSESRQSIGVKRSLFCDVDQRVSGVVRLGVVDGSDGSAVADAGVVFGCGRLASCVMPASNVRGVVRSQFPLCRNGLLRVEREGYHPFVGVLSTDDRQQVVNVSLEPLRAVSVVVKKVVTDGVGVVGSRSLTQGEEVVVLFDRVQEEGVVEVPFSARVHVSGFDEGSVDLIPGKYEISASLIDRQGFVLPAGCAEVCESFDDEGECLFRKRLPEKAQRVVPGLLGGVVWNNNTGFVELSPLMLDVGGLEVVVVRVRTPSCLQAEGCVLPDCVGMDELSRIEEYSVRFADVLRPRSRRV